MIEVNWRARAIPLEAVAVAATGVAARELGKRLLERSDDELKLVRGVSWNDGIALEGALEHLPWADGALYVGRDKAAPKLLLPCALEPDLPLDLWVRAFERGLGTRNGGADFGDAGRGDRGFSGAGAEC